MSVIPRAVAGACLLLVGVWGAADTAPAEQPRGRAVEIASGPAFPNGTWHVFARRSRGTGLCIGVARPGNDQRRACGLHLARGRPSQLMVDLDGCGNSFVAGRVGRSVARVLVRYSDGSVRAARLVKVPQLRTGGRIFLAVTDRPLGVRKVRVLDRSGRTLLSRKLGRLGELQPGDCDSQGIRVVSAA